MSGRHRRPVPNVPRLAPAGALGVLLAAPLTLALAAPAGAAPAAGARHPTWDASDEGDWDRSEAESDRAERRHDKAERDSAEPARRAERERRTQRDVDEDTPRRASRERRADDEDSARRSRRERRADDEASVRRTRQERRADDEDSARRSRSRSHGRDGQTRSGTSDGTRGGAPDRRYSDAKWDQLAECESSQNWEADTGNGYKGGLQFSEGTWRQYGGRKYAPTPDQASREQQIEVAEDVQREQGWQAWPSCSNRLGYT